MFARDLNQIDQTHTPVKYLFSREDNNQPEVVTGTVRPENVEEWSVDELLGGEFIIDDMVGLFSEERWQSDGCG